jgi:hypothetical protein
MLDVKGAIPRVGIMGRGTNTSEGFRASLGVGGFATLMDLEDAFTRGGAVGLLDLFSPFNMAEFGLIY